MRRNRDRVPGGGSGGSRRSTRGGAGGGKHKSEFVVYTGPDHEPGRELTKEQSARRDREQVLGTRVSVGSDRGREANADGSTCCFLPTQAAGPQVHIPLLFYPARQDGRLSIS